MSKISHSKLAIAVLLIFLVVVVVGLVKAIGKDRETTQNKQAALSQLNTLQNQDANLKDQINNLQTTDGIEANIRDKFRVVKDGEGLVVITDDPNATSAAPAAGSGGFLGFLKSLFK